MRSHKALIDHLLYREVLVTPAIIDAFSTIDRIGFVRRRSRAMAYGDHPLSIGHGQTISQPYTVAFMLEQLQPRPGDHVLDVGSGSGWTTALLAHIVGPRGSVLGIEIVADLVEYGTRNLARCQFPHAAIVPAGDTVGRPGERFDKILVSAAAAKLPDELVDQLNIGGRMVIPVGGSIMRLVKISAKRTEKREHVGFVFVPLIC